jgi:hypothetical protein
LSAVILIGAGTAILPTTTLFQANDSHRVLDQSVQTNSPTVTRMEYEPHSIKAAVEVPPKPTVLKSLPTASAPRISKRASRSRRYAEPSSDLYSRPHEIYLGSNCPDGPIWVKNLAHDMSSAKFGEGQWSYLDKLWTRESQFNPWCENSSGAYGVPQALPGSKMGSNWRYDVKLQIRWGLGYILDRYGSPADAWAHSQAHGWY